MATLFLRSVVSLIQQRAYWKNKTTEDMWKGWKIKRGVCDNYYVSYSEELEPHILPRAASKDEL